MARRCGARCHRVVLFDNKAGETKELAVDAVFVQVGEAPNSQLAMDLGVEVGEHRYINIDIFQRTSVPGVYAAGDVTNHSVKQVGTAVGQGITAAPEAYSYIRRPYYRKKRENIISSKTPFQTFISISWHACSVENQRN